MFMCIYLRVFNLSTGMRVLPQVGEKECGDIAKLLKLPYQRAMILSTALMKTKAIIYEFLSPIMSEATFDLNSIKTTNDNLQINSRSNSQCHVALKSSFVGGMLAGRPRNIIKSNKVDHKKATTSKTNPKLKVSDNTKKQKQLAEDGYYEDFGTTRMQQKEKSMRWEKGNS